MARPEARRDECGGVSDRGGALLRILLVEDLDDARELLTYVLRDTGAHAIALASDAGEALGHLRGGSYDLVVTDIGLPGPSGLEMLDQAAREGLLFETTVVVCSAYLALRADALARGAYWLPKPVDLEKLRDVVHARMAARERGAFEHRISSYDFVRAMLLNGFRLVGMRHGHAVLAKDEIELPVPQRDALPEDVILGLLEKARMTPLHLVTLLNRLGSRDTWPDQAEALGSPRVSRGEK